MPTLESNEAPEQIDSNSIPMDVRVIALEQALKFVMDFMKVNITQNSPIIGAGAVQTQMSLYDFYIQQLQQRQMIVGNGNGR